MPLPKQIHDDEVRVHSILDGRCPCLRRGAPVRARCTMPSTPPPPPLDVATPAAAPSRCSAVCETLGGCPGTGACESSSTIDRGTDFSPLLRPPYPGTLSSPWPPVPRPQHWVQSPRHAASSIMILSGQVVSASTHITGEEQRIARDTARSQPPWTRSSSARSSSSLSSGPETTA
jgi:hypothetical protein